MNYRDFLRNPYLLILSLDRRNLMNWIDDTLYLKLKYKAEMGISLNLDNPILFSEKLQWLKLHNRHEIYVNMVDKVKVKDYVEELIGSEYIIPTIGIWNTPDEIDFENLPSQFVIKCNHNSGTGMYICKDKSKMDIERVKENLRKGLRENYYLRGREWPYKFVQRKIIAEQFMKDDKSSELIDYKFFCFNGVPYLCQVISNRSTNETIDFFDMNWNRLKGLKGLKGLNENINNSLEEIPCPSCFSVMKDLVSTLAKGHPFIRIDFYSVNNRPYFGEITFFPKGGFGKLLQMNGIRNWVT